MNLTNPPPPSSSSAASSSSSITKQSVPKVYPQVLTLPIARRPPVLGLYKAAGPKVVNAIKGLMKRGQPYLDAFLLKDEYVDSNVITDVNAVHSVGVFA